MWPLKVNNSCRTKWPKVTLLLILVIIGEHCHGFETPDDDDGGGGGGAKDASTTEKRATIIRRAFKQLLKVNSLPSVRVKSGMTNGHGRHLNNPIATPPQYMLELYEKYRQASKMGNQASTRRGNTVRSIVAIKGNINGNQMLIFNISGIHSHEEMLSGELHFYKRRKIKWHQNQQKINSSPEYRIKAYNIDSDRANALATIEVPSRSHGWQVFDVTRMVNDCRRLQDEWPEESHHLMGIKFEGLNKRKTKFIGIPLNKFINLNSQPFLIVFSNDRANNTIDELETTHNAFQFNDDTFWHESDTLLDDEDYGNIDYELNASNQATNSKKISTTTTTTKTPNKTSTMTMTFLKRFYRSVNENSIQDGDFGHQFESPYDNELPVNPVQTNYIPRTSPDILQSRNERQRSKAAEAAKTIPYPHTMTFGKHRKNKNHEGKSSRKKQRNRKLPNIWQQPLEGTAIDRRHHQLKHENDATAPEVEHPKGDRTTCRKRKLVVDFVDIGWGEWIISPKSFEAQYCSGTCPFPLTKNLKPSNHATIQSIVHAIGLQPNVPAPCCVADTMSSITLLYFDEDRNVVLKNYPSMTVESCACR